MINKDKYTADFDAVISKKITEYDIKEAGYNLCKYYRLLSNKDIKYLESLSKHQRYVQIGIWMGKNIDFNQRLTESFSLIREEFFKANNIVDDDILSIKKDAIFIISKQCEHLSYGNATFVQKHTYSSFHKFGDIEMYYQHKNSILDIKGINDSLYQLHEKFMLNILKRLFSMLEIGDSQAYVNFLKRFVDDYKNCRLSYGYYRELNSNSLFAIKSPKKYLWKYYIPDIVDDSFDDELDISYNYMNYLLPMIQRFYF